MSDSAAHADSHDGHDHHGEATYPYTPHHFESHTQHFESGKMGVWLFLVTEILFFAGLFCAYTVYRAQHPEIFYWSHFYLDSSLGALNTAVLIFSSLTAAWAVRNAQLGQNGALKINVIVTIVCAFIFMGVKTVEYTAKYNHGTLPGRYFHPHEEVWETHNFKHHFPEAATAATQIHAAIAARAGEELEHAPELTEAQQQFVDDAENSRLSDDVWLENAIRSVPAEVRRPLEMAGVIHLTQDGGSIEFGRPHHASVFFSIYFFMTGLHGVHVLIGIGLWVWMLVIAAKRKMGKKYFGPIDFTALYWHLVDLIWIYLFPMLYLIH